NLPDGSGDIGHHPRNRGLGNSPSVSTTSNRCDDLCSRHHATSRLTHLDCAAVGDAISTSHAEAAFACWHGINASRAHPTTHPTKPDPPEQVERNRRLNG